MTASADRRRGAILQGTDPGSPPPDSGPSASDVTPAWVVGFVGFAISLGLALRFLVPAGMDATIFLALGEKSTAQTTYARTRLGDVATRYELGHDGQWFFILANDPLHLYPKENAAVLDRPLYRAQRMMYPLIASGFGSLPPEAIVWAMLVINLVAFGLGTMFAARIATVSGASPWIGLAVPLNIGLLFELWIDGSGLLAFVFCLGGVLALAERREWLAAMLFAAAALSRETMLLFAVGVLIAAWLDTRRTDWKLVAVPSLLAILRSTSRWS